MCVYQEARPQSVLGGVLITISQECVLAWLWLSAPSAPDWPSPDPDTAIYECESGLMMMTQSRPRLLLSSEEFCAN